MNELLERLQRAGARPKHAKRVCEAWLAGQPLDARADARDHPFGKSLRASLPEVAGWLASVASVETEHAGADGSARLLVRLGDGQRVESVLLYREGLCISSQVGCAVGCTFCRTGMDGLVRQLTTLEIVAQVALARARRDVRRVVFMGMGEPAHNLERVVEALTFLGKNSDLGHKDLVVSTVGDARVFERLLANEVRPALALSLHSTDDALRARLLPRAPRIAVSELVERGDAYARAVGYPLIVQWTLIAGLNDGDAEIEALERLLAGRFAMLNFIPYNRVDGLAYERPDVERMREIGMRLNAKKIVAKLRRSAGQDVDGACGQLRARSAVEART